MKIQSIVIVLLLSMLCISIGSAQSKSQATVSAKDFKLLIGSWKGSLTYLDYTSKKPYTMPADINIKQIGKSNKYIFAHIYPDEPKANSSDTIIISNDGKMLDKENVTSHRELGKDSVEIVTEIPGKDGNDNKPATLKHTYTIGKKSFTIRKDVKFDGTEEWIQRHEYVYKRK